MVTSSSTLHDGTPRTKLSKLIGQTVYSITYGPRNSVEFRGLSGNVFMTVTQDQLFDKYGNYFHDDG